MTARPINVSTTIVQRFEAVRRYSEALAKPYSEADQTVQSMPDASPVKWHLAHTTWFFETFILKSYFEGYKPFNPHYEFLFNSYYNSVGEQFSRPNRGLITRPGKEEVLRYRAYVDEHMAILFDRQSQVLSGDLNGLLDLGLAHEQQHQELLVTDILHAMSFNPMYPEITDSPNVFPLATPHQWLNMPEGIYEIGHQVDEFAFDNEGPKHKHYLNAYSVADQLVTNGEYLSFMDAGGYEDPLLWLSEGWAWKKTNGINAPLYWLKREDQWFHYSLAGLQPLDLNAPVTHISYFEANAYASWCEARLPTEYEWEAIAQRFPNIETETNPSVLQPEPQTHGSSPMSQLFNTLWQWTGSQYLAYPGFNVPEGAVGEYNGKFMSNQFVLRGGSCVTPKGHIRSTYRNFFPASARWQFTGIRIAKDD